MKRLSYVFEHGEFICAKLSKTKAFIAKLGLNFELEQYNAHRSPLVRSCLYIKAKTSLRALCNTRPTPPRLSTQLNNRLTTAPTASQARRIATRRTLDQDATPGTSQPLGQRSAWSYILSSNFAPHVSQNTYNILLHSFTAVATQLYGIYM